MDDPRRGALDVTLRNLVTRHQLKVVSAAMLLAVVLGIFLITRDDVPPPPRVELASDAGPAELSTATSEVLAKIEEQPVTTTKGRLLKEQMKKRIERGRKGTGGSGTGGGTSGTRTKVATGGGSLDVALTGDAELRKALHKKLRSSSVRIVDESSGRWLASLSMTTGEGKGGLIFAKCSAAMSELPQRKLVGSLANRADVSGDGANDDELKAAARSSCAESLAEDVAIWVRTHR